MEDGTPERWLADTAVLDAAGAKTATTAVASTPLFDRERFEEIAELGRGGMGRVYAAHDHLLHRVVAVKQALSDDASVQERFAREIQIAARLQHPSLLPVLEAGRDDRGRPFFVMNRVEGRSLDREITATTDTRRRLALVSNIAAIVDAVAYAHARGVIHRDIKPANILIGQFGESLLIDWGIARVLDDASEDEPRRPAHGELTQSGASIGTPGFMPPEQARGELAGRPADVYALGGTLYYVLSGKRPFDALTPTAAVAHAANEMSPDYEAISDEVPNDLVAIVKRAMAPRARDRYPDAGELAADLRAFLAGQLVAAHDYTLRERLSRWVRRHRLVVAVAASAAIAIAIVAVLAVANVVSARRVAVAARVDAETRLVDLLENLAASDPDYVLARLAELPDSSPVWRRARGAVITAVHAGAGRGVSLGTSFARPQVRSDGRELVMIEPGWRAIRFLDPGLRGATSVLPLDAEITQLQWVEDGSALLAATKEREVLHIDRTSLRQRRLLVGAARSLTLVEGAALVLADQRLLALDLEGGEPRELATGVSHAARLNGATLCVTDTALIAVRDGGVVVQVSARSGAGDAYPEVHPGGRRLAYASTTTVVELDWDGADGPVERGRWSVPAAADRLIYSGDKLLAEAAAAFYVLEPGESPRRIALEGHPTVTAWQPDGTYALIGNEIVWITGRGAVSLVRGASAFQYLAVAGGFLVAVDRTGTLRSWRRDHLLVAKQLPSVPHGAGIAGTGAGQVVVVGGSGAKYDVWRVSLSTLAIEALGRPPASSTYPPVFRCESDGRWLAHAGDAWNAPAPLVQVGVGLTKSLGVLVKGVLGCTDDAVALLTVDAVEVRDRRDVTRVITRIPAPEAQGAAFAAGHVLIHRPNGTFDLFDQSGRWLRSSAVGRIGAFALDETGAVLYELSGRLYLWAGAEPRALEVQTPGLAVRAIGAADGRFVVRGGTSTLVTDTNVTLLVDAQGHIARWPNSDARPQWDNARLVTASSKGEITITDTRDGTAVRLSMPGFQESVVLTDDTVVAISTSLELLRIVRLDDVPSIPAALRAWVREVSNARVEPGSTYASFPPP